MSEEEFKKYVEEMCKNIASLLENHKEELDFIFELMKIFNQVCEEKNKLEQQVEKQQKAIEKSIKYIEKFPEIRHFIENPKEYELLYYREDHIHNEYALDIEEAKRIIKYMDMYFKTKDLYEMCLKNIVITTKRKNDLEQTLDEIEKICKSILIEDSICGIEKIHDIEVIIQKAKGDGKDEN